MLPLMVMLHPVRSSVRAWVISIIRPLRRSLRNIEMNSSGFICVHLRISPGFVLVVKTMRCAGDVGLLASYAQGDANGIDPKCYRNKGK